MKPAENPLVIPVKRIMEHAYTIQTDLASGVLDLEYLYFCFKDAITLDLQASMVSREILVQGTLKTVVDGECARCLNRVRIPLECNCTYLYPYTGQDFQDISEDVRDELLLALPGRVLCPDEDPAPRQMRFQSASKALPKKNPFSVLPAKRPETEK